MNNSNTCSICLEDINRKDIIKKLSCDHILHFHCFKKLVFNHGNFYVSCPLCRVFNFSIDYPLKDDYKNNILMMCHKGVSKIKCSHIKKDGTKCKLTSRIMNYGCCHIHNKIYLKDHQYELFCKYLYHILNTNYKWISILYLIDFGKKVIIRFLKEDSGLENILEYLYRYIHLSINDDASVFFMNKIFDFYKLENPPFSWLKYCNDKKTII